MANEVETGKPEVQEKDPEPAAQQNEEFEVLGRKFDLATPEGKRDLKVWSEAMAFRVGSQGQELGDLRKEVAPLRKYGIKSATPDEAKIVSEVERLNAEGRPQDAVKLTLEYSRQVAAEADAKLERERLWADYKSANKDVFETLPEDMAKDYVFRNYQAKLEEADDPLALIDRVLRPKVAKNKTLDDVPVLAGKGVAGAASPKPGAQTGGQAKPDEGEGAGSWNKMLDEMGFKD